MRNWLRRSLRRCRRDESGVVLALTAVIMISMLGLAAFAIDVGGWYQTRRQAQAAADAAALAGVQDLPGNPAQARTDASNYVVSNGFTAVSATITTPYPTVADTSEIKVVVSTTAPSFFAKVLGVNSVTVTGTAAAKRAGGVTPSAVFSSDSNCSNQSMVINGNNVTVTGGTHSNGSFFNNANNGTFGTTTYGGPNGCSYTANGNNNTYGGSPTPTVDPTLQPWPYDYSISPPACTYGNLTSYSAGFTWNNSNTSIPAGVYCTTGQISINGNLLTGNVTFIAASFNLNGNSETFTPYAQNLLFYQTGTNTLVINGNSYVALGTVFAPNATIVLNGNSGSVSGFLEGKDVNISGNSLAFVGTGPPPAGAGGSSLVQ